MALQVGMYHFHCADPVALAGFWSGVLEIPVDEGATEDLAMIDFVHAHGPITWIFQRTEGISAEPNRLVLDLSSEDWQAQAERVESLGARRLGEHEVEGVRWIDLNDIEGNLLRIFAPRPESS